jgi:hypothetical protein
MYISETKAFDYEKLYQVVQVVVTNLNNVIDINYYPTPKTKRSNFKHRPVGIGVQGLADVFFKMDLAFVSDEAKEINIKIFETIYYAALEKSMLLSKQRLEAMRFLKEQYYLNNWTFISDEDELPKFDYYCPLMSLPLIYNTNLDKIPDVNFGYIVDDCKRTHWIQKIGIKTKPRVGIAWSGNPSHSNDHNRSIELANFMSLMPNDFEFISLQINIKDRDLDVVQLNQIKHFGGDIADFTDTATLCDLVDVVISVDTSVAHLSASMQKPTWVLLPFSPDWRWLLDREDSPWYPSVKLYRQNSLGDWKTVLKRISTDLSKLKGI